MLPWGYTVNLHGAWDWIVPGIIVMLGIRLNILFTGRIPIIVSWITSFIVFAGLRSWYFGYPFAGQLVILTGIPMVLFTLYMITDPQTSPSKFRSQILYGSSIAFFYSVLLMAHVQYTMFYAIAAVCVVRGMWLYWVDVRETSSSLAAVSVARGSSALTQEPIKL